MFVMHGYSGPCPGPPLPKKPTQLELVQSERDALRAALVDSTDMLRKISTLQFYTDIKHVTAQISANEAALMKGGT